MTASQRPGDAEQLREEIERTREQLAAKVDIKGRAQAKAAALAGQVTRQARAAVAQGREQAAQAREQGSRAARKHRVPLSAAVAAGLLAAVAVIIWQRSKR